MHWTMGCPQKAQNWGIRVWNVRSFEPSAHVGSPADCRADPSDASRHRSSCVRRRSRSRSARNCTPQVIPGIMRRQVIPGIMRPKCTGAGPEAPWRPPNRADAPGARKTAHKGHFPKPASGAHCARFVRAGRHLWEIVCEERFLPQNGPGAARGPAGRRRRLGGPFFAIARARTG